jgi:hypothetical protein
MPTCDDLRIGGVLSSTGIAGGTSINGTAYTITDWSEIFGAVGMSGSPVEVFGRPGSYFAGDGLPSSRFPTLNLAILDRNTSGGLTEPTFAEQKEANTDTFLAIAASRSPVPLEVTMADGTERYLLVRNLDDALISQPRRLRTISIPLYAEWGWWHAGGNESTDTINGADTLVVGGSVPVYDAVLTFAGDGTFTHSTLGWAIEVTGSGGPVTVDLGARTVTEGGNPAPNRIRRTVVPDMGRVWGWFTVGNNSVSSDVSVTVTWRNQYP